MGKFNWRILMWILLRIKWVFKSLHFQTQSIVLWNSNRSKPLLRKSSVFDHLAEFWRKVAHKRLTWSSTKATPGIVINFSWCAWIWVPTNQQTNNIWPNCGKIRQRRLRTSNNIVFDANFRMTLKTSLASKVGLAPITIHSIAARALIVHKHNSITHSPASRKLFIAWKVKRVGHKRSSGSVVFYSLFSLSQ